MTDGITKKIRFYQRWNWWKVGFFVMLVLFEFAREIAVLGVATKAQPNVAASVTSFQGYTVAKGRWTRVDGGGALMPATVTIQCVRERSECVEAAVRVLGTYVSAPDVNIYPATFTKDSISYESAHHLCVTYSTRIDLKLQKVFAVRDKKANATEPLCRPTEARVEMQLGNGFDADREPLKSHFVPLISAFAAILNAV
ncbi:hypothetical protein ACG3SL_13760 [Sphingomonas sp. CJ20]